MTKQIIVTDSTSDLSKEYLEANNIHVIPLSLTIEGASYVDQVDITSEEFINHIENDEDVKTSQPAIGEFISAYEELGKDGSEIISIHLSSGLSGTYNTANVIEYVDKLKKVFNEAFHVNNYDINVTTPVISAHTGQGAIGLVVLKK